MRHWFGTVAAVGFLAVAGVQAGAAETAAPRMQTFGDAANGDRPVILRGSAVAPQAAPAVTPAGQRYQVAAGQRLWFFDPVTQDIRSCINQQTSTVGVRIVRCTGARSAATAGPSGRRSSPERRLVATAREAVATARPGAQAASRPRGAAR